MQGNQKIIFIDRDGVINVDPIGDYVKSWADFKFESGAVEGLKNIHNLGYKIIIISNQAGVGDGVYSEKALEEIHHNMVSALAARQIPILGAHYCLHGKNAGCSCRKPKTGLFEKALEGLQIDKTKTYFVGDKLTDMQAGVNFGLRTVFVRTGHGRDDEPRLKKEGIVPDIIADNLLEASKILI